jgi:hypothetical protein
VRQRRTALATAIGLVTAASLGLLGWQWLTGSTAVASGTSASLGGLTTHVESAGWMEFDMGHVMDGQGGFMMPDAMMPGAPTGTDRRLGVNLTLSNTADGVREFSLPDEFTLTGGVASQPVPLVADTLGELPRLAPGSAVNAVLYFDLEVPGADDPPLYLQWTRNGDTIRIPVPIAGNTPEEHEQH